MLTLTNARLFDGREMVPGKRSVTLDGNRVVSVAAQPGADSGRAIDLEGMTLMPGLITCHLHADFYRFSLAQGLAGERLGKEFPPGVMMAIGVRTCRVLLESGFTGYVGACAATTSTPSSRWRLPRTSSRGRAFVPAAITSALRRTSTTAANGGGVSRRRATDLFVDGPDALRGLSARKSAAASRRSRYLPAQVTAIPGRTACATCLATR